MSRKTRDPDFPMGKLIRIKDVLPPPGQLGIPPEETVKVTLHLSKVSVNFFKQQAAEHHTKYQRMIRQVIDRYTEHYAHGR